MEFDNKRYFELAARLIKQKRHKELEGYLVTDRNILVNFQNTLLEIAATKRNKEAQELLQKHGFIQTSQKQQLAVPPKQPIALHATPSFDDLADKPESIYSVHSSSYIKSGSSQSSTESISSFSSASATSSKGGILKQHKMLTSRQPGKLKIVQASQAPRKLFAPNPIQRPKLQLSTNTLQFTPKLQLK